MYQEGSVCSRRSIYQLSDIPLLTASQSTSTHLTIITYPSDSRNRTKHVQLCLSELQDTAFNLWICLTLWNIIKESGRWCLGGNPPTIPNMWIWWYGKTSSGDRWSVWEDCWKVLESSRIFVRGEGVLYVIQASVLFCWWEDHNKQFEYLFRVICWC